MIEIKNLCKSFGNNLIFKDVNLKIEKGDCVVIIGGSGCGKSTLLRCINGLIDVDSGEILYDGKDITKLGDDITEVRKKIGMVYQQFNLFSHLNVIENVMLAPMKVLGKTRDEAMKDAEKILKKVGLEKRMLYMPDELSGGQKQRVAIARSLAMKPDVILFDEPTSALDPEMVDEVENVIKDLSDNGMTCVIVTHGMSFAKRMASKVVFMAEQGIYEEGDASIFEQPTKNLTRRFIYRTKLKELELDPKTFDIYSTYTALKSMLIKYEYTNSQKLSIQSFIDEIICPAMYYCKELKKIRIKFVASESSTSHMMFVSFIGLDSDPLKQPYMDELNLKLLESYVFYVDSHKNGDGEWEIFIQI